MAKQIKHKELHLHERVKRINIGHYFKDIVFAANDGIVTTFAVIAGVAGAELSAGVILIIGFANLVADGFSMATGNYLGTKSEHDLYRREEAIEKHEIEHLRHKELEEVTHILQEKGYNEDDAKEMTVLISKNEKYWIDFMMHEEMGLFAPDSDSPFKKGLVTYISFFIAGLIPIIPYLIGYDKNTFLIASVITAIELFIIGSLRHFFTDRNWLYSGIEMLIVGGSAAVMAYYAGIVLKSITNGLV